MPARGIHYPGTEPVLQRGGALTDLRYYGGASGWGWGGSVALGLQRRGGASESVRSILLSLLGGAGLEHKVTRSVRAYAFTTHI